MAKYSKFDVRNKKKRNDKYKSEKRFSSPKPKENMRQSELYDAEFDLPSLRGRQKV